MIHILAAITLTLYAASSVSLLIGLTSRSSAFRAYGTRLWKGGFLALSIFALSTLFQDRVFYTAGDYFLWVAWFIEVAGIMLRIDFPVVRLFISTIILTIFTSSSYLVHHELANTAASVGPLFVLIHVLPALIAEVLLLLAFAVSGTYIVQQRRLKSKSIDSLVDRGPSLVKLESLLRRLTLSGFLCMTVAIISGSLQAAAVGAPFFSADPTRWSALIAWLLLGILVHATISLEWSSKRIARVTLAGVPLFFLAYVAGIIVTGKMLHENFTP
jgi:ABC-type uncharacterized transport system permease subunit